MITPPTNEILERLKRYPLLQTAQLEIVIDGLKTKLLIRSSRLEPIAQLILGIARLADSYGLSEVILLGGKQKPLTFPTSALSFYGMDELSIDRIKQRSLRHQPLLNALAQRMVFLHSQEEPYTYLDVRCSIEERLNVPLLELLGSPVDRVASEISDPKRFWIKRAVELGAAQHYFYSYTWKNLDWRFRVDVAPLAGTEEAITIVSDAEAWQKQWWLAQVNHPSLSRSS